MVHSRKRDRASHGFIQLALWFYDAPYAFGLSSCMDLHDTCALGLSSCMGLQTYTSNNSNTDDNTNNTER